MADPESNNPHTDAPQQGKPSPLQPSWQAFPRWWCVLVISLVSLSFAARFLDQAVGRISLAAVIVVSILIACVRPIWAPRASKLGRAMPMILFASTLIACFATVRFDEMDGNLVPRRVSFRWRPAPDQRLRKLAPRSQTIEIDLGRTTPDDFPQFLGPQRNGSVEVALSGNWSDHAPQLIWKKEEFGAGHSGFAAVNGHAVTLEQRGAEESVSCYEITSGHLVWSRAITARHETVPGGVGPRSTPTIYDGYIYTMGATGILHCLEGATGDVVWQKDLLAEIGTTTSQEYDTVQWGRAASPIIDQGHLIVPLGLAADPSRDERGATLIALDAETGDELWRQGRFQISYASPVIATIDGVRQVLQVCESEAAGFDAQTGSLLWEYSWPGDSAGNASCSQPLVIDEHRVLLSKGYAHGAALLEIHRLEDAWQVQKVWHKRVMKTKLTNALLYEGHIYGLDDGILSCVELETGNRVWKRGRYGHGQVLRAEDKLLVQAENGDVALVQATPEEYRELGRFSAIDGRTWNYPCLYGTKLLVRNSQQAACYQLPAKTP